MHDTRENEQRGEAPEPLQHPARDEQHQHAADAAAHAAEPDDRADGSARKGIGRHREHVGGPRLMAGGGDADEGHGRPQVLCHDTERRDREPCREERHRRGECHNTGAGADCAARVSWSRELTTAEADRITPAAVFGG